MKRYYFCSILLAFTFSLSSLSAQEVFKNEDLSISKLKDKVWVVETTDMTTMYIIEGEDKAMLIDTGTDCKALDQVVRRITQKPLYVVLTHNHPDHAGNIYYFDEIYMHPNDTAIHLGNDEYKGKIHFVKEGDVFDLGGIKLDVYLMPGHTPGSIILVDKASGICYSSDAFGSGAVWLQLQPNTPMSIYLQSCERMAQIMEEQGITEIYCGHYPYLKRALGKDYISQMTTLARKLANGDTSGAKEYTGPKIGCDNPMVVSEGFVSIVYDPETIK